MRWMSSDTRKRTEGIMIMSEETPTETTTEEKPTESQELPRDDKGRFLPKKTVEPLYSKREPESTDKKGTFTKTMEEHRDLLLEFIPDGVTLPKDFEEESLRTQIKILKYMRDATKKEPTDEPKAQPLDKTGKPKVGGEVPAPTTVHVPSLLEKNRAPDYIREVRSKTGYTKYRDKWKQAK